MTEADDIRQRLRDAAWFGNNTTAGQCRGCQKYAQVRAAYNGGQGLGWGACGSCIAVLRGLE